MHAPTWPTDDPDRKHIERGIHYWTQKLVRTGHFNIDDCEDVAQEMRMDLLKRLRAFDECKSSRRTFISMVLRKHHFAILEERTAKKRDSRCEAYSLDEPVTNDDPDSALRVDLLSSDDYRLALSGPAMPSTEHLDLCIDMVAVVGSLPEEQKHICIQIASGVPVESIAVSLGRHRSTIDGRIAKIRKRFCAVGLEPPKNSARHFGRRSGK
jgi:DNA-directed RNA polymerase specialized sigma24 family protein